MYVAIDKSCFMCYNENTIKKRRVFYEIFKTFTCVFACDIA